MITTASVSQTKQHLIGIIMLIALLALVACSGAEPEVEAAPAPTNTPSVTGTIVLGDVSDDAAEKLEEFQPLADYLAANLNEYGIGVGKVKIAPDLETMSAWLASGEVDLYFDSAYPTIVIGESSGAYPILRRWKGGVAEYNSVIAVRTDSDFNTLDDLTGHMIGFEDEHSSSGYFMPLTFLLDNGFNVVQRDSASASVADDELGYVFTGDDENTVQWVFSGEIDAGAIQSTDFDELPEETKSELRVLASTDMMPRHLVVLRPDMDSEVEAAITKLLLRVHETAEGPEILETFEETAQFDEIPQQATEFLSKIRDLFLQFQEE